MLRTKDSITTPLDGLEVFLDVGVMSWNSSKLQMAGEPIYTGHQVELAVCSRCPIFCVGVGSSNGMASVQLVSNSFKLVVGLLMRCLQLTVG